ncbi:signal peptidase II [Sphingomonas bacterium]|uniref:signal peptidase II n=1 Tax=Sphingomonas bacterium TaxID=1895847 RepID=UPI0015752218|nr:signal peptidase II [Sphingomonas bacterium]
MRRVPIVGLAAAALLFVLDQLAKLGVTRGIALDEFTPPYRITGFFNLRLVANHGVSLGLFQADSHGARLFLIALTGAIAVAVAVWMARERNRIDQAALGLILGGAIGNILDRVRLGYVVDYADFHLGEWRPFLVFNLADAAISIGVILLLVRALLMRDKPPRATENSHA